MLTSKRLEGAIGAEEDQGEERKKDQHVRHNSMVAKSGALPEKGTVVLELPTIEAGSDNVDDGGGDGGDGCGERGLTLAHTASCFWTRSGANFRPHLRR